VSAGFQCWWDRFGDLYVADGVVIQPREGVRILVGVGGGFSKIGGSRGEEDFQAVRAGGGATFVGGSGRNLISTGLMVGLSTGEKPVGFFRPLAPGIWKLGGFRLEVLGASSATISDGVDIVAEQTVGTAPEGDFDSTTYGEATYNSDDPFTLAVAAEGDSVGIPAAEVSVNAGTAQAGQYSATDEATWVSDIDADWTIVTALDGTAELLYLGDAMAERAAGNPNDPSGLYEATALGMATFNLTTDEPVDGEPWTALVRMTGKVPRVGYVYLELIEASGVLTEVNGPFFGSALPSPGVDTFYVQLAYSDGTAMEQDHLGALLWQ
jgi:hypothetical protein